MDLGETLSWPFFEDRHRDFAAAITTVITAISVYLFPANKPAE